MNKVYLLLRENRESGPYTIDELIQQQLKASDLVWVEGKSAAWFYPYELDELKGHVPVKPVLQVVPPSNPSMAPLRGDGRERERIFAVPSVAASYQPDEIESKADQIRNNIISYAQQNKVPYMRPVTTEPSSGAVWSRQEGFEFVHHTRKKYVTLPQLIATGLITILLASAWYGDWSTIRVKPNVVTVASAPAAFNEERPQPKMQTSMVAVPDSQALAQAEALYSQEQVPMPVKSQGSVPVTHESKSDSDQVEKATPATVAVDTEVAALSNTETNAAEKEPEKAEVKPVEIKEPKKETASAGVKSAPETEKQVAEEDKEEKKKKLGQVIKGIFKKKDKE